jgi:hypothetical protein
VRCCAAFATILREANRDDRSGDRFGKLKADVRVTRQRSKRSAADALRSRLVMSADFAKDGIYRSSRKPCGRPSDTDIFLYF